MVGIPLPPATSLDYLMPEIWDSTMICAFRRCETYFLYKYANHFRGDRLSIPLHFGGTFAAGLEAYRKAYFANNGNADTAYSHACEVMINFWGDNPSQFIDERTRKADKRTLDRAMHALENYFIQWPIHSDLLQPHINTLKDRPTFEFSFAVPLDEPCFPRQDDGSPFILVGRADTLGTYDGLPVIEDDKTTTAMGDKWAEQWYTRHQFITYIWALRKVGFKQRHVVVRGICIRNEEVAFAQTPPIVRHDHLLDKWQEELGWTMHQAKAYFAAKRFPRRYGDACYSHYRKCEFWDVCDAKPRNEMSFLSQMKRTKWDPLHLSVLDEE